LTRRPGKVDGGATPSRFRRAALPAILLVEADESQRAMLRDALLEGSGPFDLRSVAGAEELEAYLARDGAIGAPTPSLVIVDLDRDASEPFAAIARLKGDAALDRVPVLALTSDRDPALVGRAYDAGVNTLLPKPVTFLALVRLVKVLTAYWLDAAILPAPEDAA
jgi:CheY-like chemotaxis protein